MKTKRIFVCGLFAVLLALNFIACDNGNSPGNPGPGPTPMVTSVTVSAAGGVTYVNKPSETDAGTLQFSAVVNGANSPPQGVTWTVTGGVPGTSITGGLLTVAEGETALLLIVKATSTFDQDISGYYPVTVRDSSKSDLSESVTTDASDITLLDATYGGSESVTYQWYKNGVAIEGATSATYTPTGPGSYTVMVSVEGYNPSMSAPVTVADDDVPPENRPVADRWYKWKYYDATATVDYSVAADGVCTITVGGIAHPNNETDNWGIWRVHAGYYYTANANTCYEYTFEAWTLSGSRVVNWQYYNGSGDDEIFLGKEIMLTTEHKTYSIKGLKIPKSGIEGVDFQCANQLGTFYVKIISIEEYTPVLEYELIDGGTAYRVIESPGMSGAVTIPPEYNGKPVTEIGGEYDEWYETGAAFAGNRNITSISIPASVTSIGRDAFVECIGLTSVTFAQGSQLKTINEYAFNSCTGLANITIPASVTYIDHYAFGYCINLAGLTFETGSQLEIGHAAFADCTKLASVTIPSSVTYINEWAFGGCPRLTTVTFEAGSSLTETDFGWGTFPQGNNGDGGDNLKYAYLAGGAGTYRRNNNSSNWTKQ